MRLIIAADDFGFSEAFSIGVMKACSQGVATVAGLMVNMPAAPFAVELQKREMPSLCLVQHTNFVQGAPCSRPEDIPSLVDERGMFHRSSAYKNGGTRTMDYKDCKRETIAQIERFKELIGEYPIHVEGHSVISESVLRGINDAAREYGLHHMDTDGSPQAGFAKATERFDGMDMIEAGLQVDDFLMDRMSLLDGKDEVRIIHCHPGYIDQYLLDNTSLTLPRCRDLDTLCDYRVRAWLEEKGIELIDYRALRV